MNYFLLDILSFGTILSSILVITSKNPVVAVIFLISLFINTAGYLILFGISFVGISYIIIYIGAITVLFLFIIMMINIRLLDILEIGNEYTKNLPLALLVGTLFVYEIFNVLPFTINNIFILDLPLDILNFFNTLFLDKSIDISTGNVVNIAPVVNKSFETISSLKTSGLSEGLVVSMLSNSKLVNAEADLLPIYNIKDICDNILVFS